jgi:hypothetical protein
MVATLDPGSPLYNFNQEISSVLQLSLSPRQRLAHLAKYRQKYYQDLFDLFPETSSASRVQHLIDRWTAQPSDVATIATEWLNLINQNYTNTSIQTALIDLFATRRSRWDHLAKQLGIAMPDAFRAYRGVSVSPTQVNRFADIIRILKGNPKAYIPVSQRSLGSWSLAFDAARRFATVGEYGLIYEADIPFGLTLADKWLDDADFIYRFGSEEEVIVLGAGSTLAIPTMVEKIWFTRSSNVYRATQVSQNAHLLDLFK